MVCGRRDGLRYDVRVRPDERDRDFPVVLRLFPLSLWKEAGKLTLLTPPRRTFTGRIPGFVRHAARVRVFHIHLQNSSSRFSAKVKPITKELPMIL